MKRLVGLEVALMAALCGGIVHACAAPEELDPLVLSEAENKYFATTAANPPATPPPATPPGTPPSSTTPPATPPTASVPPVTPPPATPFAPALGDKRAEGDELEPADAIPLEQWLNQ